MGSSTRQIRNGKQSDQLQTRESPDHNLPESCLDCLACPRLVDYREALRPQWPDHHNAPVPAWGSARARLLVIGLAPGLHGAHRTGRPFTGDRSGEALVEALLNSGWVSRTRSGLRLGTVRITNVVRCLPPENLPTRDEIDRCNPYLTRELRELFGRRRRGVAALALGHGAWRGLSMALGRRLPPFAHGAITEIGPQQFVASVYHPSQRNINTGRVTLEGLSAAFGELRHRCA